MPRFAVLNHDHPFSHWDLLLQSGETCRTWRLLSPLDAPSGTIVAQALNDHRVVYLNYEGPISGGRGVVSRWDAGQFEWVRNEDDVCEVILSGRTWSGRLILSRGEAGDWNVDRL